MNMHRTSITDLPNPAKRISELEAELLRVHRELELAKRQRDGAKEIIQDVIEQRDALRARAKQAEAGVPLTFDEWFNANLFELMKEEHPRDIAEAAWNAAQRAAPLPFAVRLSEWADKTFPKSTPQTVVTHLMREVEELNKAFYESASGDVSEEAADVFMMLTHLANKMEFDLLAEAERKFEIVQKREWGKPDADGVVEHVRAAPPPAPAAENGEEK